MDKLFSSVRTALVLVLEGVHLADLDTVAVVKKRQVTIRRDPPPTRFILPELHPTTTPLLCHTCSLGCREYPKFVPVGIKREWFHPAILTRLREHYALHGTISEQIFNENFTAEFRTGDLIPLEICETRGVFCEWSCAVAYARLHLPAVAQWDAIDGIRLFESKFTGKQRAVIHPSPPRQTRREYCGDSGLTESQYRDILDDLKS